jgi:hypothetical protein
MTESAPTTLAEHPLVTDGMRRARGTWDEWSRWSEPIRDSDIRRWAIAVYWPEAPPRRYWDPALTADALLAPEDFNPFAWPAPRSPGVRARTDDDRRPDPARVRGRVNGGCEVRYGAPMRTGDRIRRRVRLQGWRVAESSRGTLLLVDYEHEWRNDRDELVRTAVYTLIHW